MLITFIDFYTGIAGLLSVLVTITLANWIGLNKFKIQEGYYGFNSLLVGLGIGVYFQPGGLLFFIVLLAGVLTLLISVALEGVIGKYALPYLSIPFVLSLWALTLASREFSALGLNERGIYTLNDLYIIGGNLLVQMYEWWNNIALPFSIRAYFLSLGAIFFQYNVLVGIIIAIGVLIYSRIGFTLSLIGFYTAYFFYSIIGAQFSEVTYSYIGFNYILTAIAIGGYFIVPNFRSYLWSVLLIPLVAILTISLSTVLAPYYLPIYSLPFNIISLLFLYFLKFRLDKIDRLNTVIIQQNSPEKNLYSFVNFQERFGKDSPTPIYLPFHGEWVVTQGHNGKYTHKDNWKHAWDFEIKNEEGKLFQNSGDFTDDYYCYNKTIIAPADGIVENVLDDIPDNIIGEKNLKDNWGNTVVIKHDDNLYTKLSHLKAGTIEVKEGDKIKRSDMLGKCGNSGNSPYPHLHFQVQNTPYIGSATIDYPISNYFLKTSDDAELKTIAVPKKDNVVSNLKTNPALKKAFHFIPGEKLKFSVIEDTEYDVEWEVKIDYYLNKYIQWENSKAFFKVDDSMLYFTHFEGDRESLLCYFYLAAYKVCLDFNKDLTLQDSYPLNMIFSSKKLFFQDFIAPFYRYKKGKYSLTYISMNNHLFDSQIMLEAKTTATVFGKIKSEIDFKINIDNSGLKEFNIKSKHKSVKACIKK